MCLCVRVELSACQVVWLSVCLFVSLSVWLSAFLFVCLVEILAYMGCGDSLLVCSFSFFQFLVPATKQANAILNPCDKRSYLLFFPVMTKANSFYCFCDKAKFLFLLI